MLAKQLYCTRLPTCKLTWQLAILVHIAVVVRWLGKCYTTGPVQWEVPPPSAGTRSGQGTLSRGGCPLTALRFQISGWQPVGCSFLSALTATAVTLCSNLPTPHPIHPQLAQKHTVHVELPSSYKKARVWPCMGSVHYMSTIDSQRKGAKNVHKVVHPIYSMH